MQSISENVQSTVNSIHLELRGSSRGKQQKKTAKKPVSNASFKGKPLPLGVVSSKVFSNLTPNDTKLSRREAASFR
jgi:hypothetical protein